MAARRLVVVMLVLLFVSSLAAALAPVQPGDETTTTEGSTTNRTAAARAPGTGTGALVRATLDVGARRPSRVVAAVGDQLQLRVDGRRPATVEIPRLGATESVGPLAPARFDLLLPDSGTYAVRLLETGTQVGVIAVRPEARPQRPRPPRSPRRGRDPVDTLERR